MDVDSVTVPADIELLLRSYPSLQYVPDKNRVKCTWTEHEMPARLSSIENYVKGKKYQQFLKKKLDNDYLGKYKMFLEPSHKKDHERQLFCKLTWRHLNKEPHHILRHLQGKRFQRALTLCM
ncbi:unnamed protein product [Didymodactylos carnosus]|uniref:Uncharacterized protein n=1 Tax=Didymodactylos carnosus TaxID=1234261 RepID=A0A8S2GAR5_9BILA|nr:unnamed protein product [Didymodactylos carnosus]CAF4478168.1 unnamed protein product [Didymodactylos carnosus]